jgi:hypothetical protein
MAQLSGVMTADFSDFYFEVDKSVVKLKEMEGASGHTNAAMGDLSAGLGVADKTLNALGIHIGPQIQAIRELGNVSGLTFEKLGLWGSLGLAASVGAATYQITTMALEFTGLDKAIAGAVDAWAGFDAQRAGAAMDVLARATQIAGREIKDFDTAMQIIKTHNREVAESFNTGAQRVADWNREIAAHKADMPQITAELKNHSSTVQQLAQHYGISREAIEYYTRRVTENAATLAKWHEAEDAALKKVRTAQDELNEATGHWHQTLTTMAPAVIAAGMNALSLGVSQTTVATAMGLSAAQVEALDRQMKLNLATMAATEPALGTLDQWIKTNVGDTKAWNTEWRFTSEVIDTQVIPSLDAVTAKAVTASATIAAVTGASAGVPPGMTQMSPGNAPVGINTGNITYGTLGSFEATFAEYQRRHPSGGMLGGAIGGGPPADFLTWALSMGLAQRAPTVNNVFNIVDTESGIARRVGDTITSQVQRGSLVN